jgi:hypothetical protein
MWQEPLPEPMMLLARIAPQMLRGAMDASKVEGKTDV